MSTLLENNLASYSLKPEKIVIPNDSSDMVRVFKEAHRESRKIAIFGNGTQSDLGGPLSVGDITVSTRGLNAIIEHDVQNLTATVQSGIEFNALQRALKSKGQFIPLDPYVPTNATIGGVVATNASGPRRFHFGTCRDLILGMTFILPDATSAKIGGKTMKNVAGFEIGKLFIGSMGTLGVIDRLTFRLYPVPDVEKTVLIICEDDESFRRLQKTILASKLVFTTIDLFDSYALKRMGHESDENAIGITVRFEGNEDVVDYGIRMVSDIVEKNGSAEVNEVEGTFWEDISAFHLDDQTETRLKASVPVADAMDVVNLIRKMQKDLSVQVPVTGHAGNGILYAHIPSVQPEDAKHALRRLRTDVEQMNGRLTILKTTEAVRSEIDMWGVREPLKLELSSNIKKRFDPENILVNGRYIGGI